MSIVTRTSTRAGGRQPSTSRAQLSHIALQLFIERGFDETTIEDIAAAAGIGRRTFFRYFESKNDLPWGDFDSLLDSMREFLRRAPTDQPLIDVLSNAVVDFNSFPPEEVPFHRKRMELLLTVPALVAHSTLRYASWRQVIAEYVSERMELPAESLEPQVIAGVLLAISVSSYEEWLRDDSAELAELLQRSFGALRHTLDAPSAGPVPPAV